MLFHMSTATHCISTLNIIRTEELSILQSSSPMPMLPHAGINYFLLHPELSQSGRVLDEGRSWGEVVPKHRGVSV